MSPTFDLSIVLVPVCTALASLAAIAYFEIEQPLWAYLFFFVAFDVAHVWSTIYITYLDREVMRRRQRLLWTVVPLCFAVSFGLHAISPLWFWTAIAYVAVFHFAKQQYGFVAMYKAKARERHKFDYYLDKWTLWLGTMGPVAIWHATPMAEFDWFDSGEDFLVTFPPWVQWAVGAVMAVVALVYLGRQCWVWNREQRVNVGKNLWMGATWLSWILGILGSDHLLISAAFLNLLHGLPYLALIWRRCNVRWQNQERLAGEPSRLVSWVSQRHRWIWFYALVFALAIVEEILWDGLVWRKYMPGLTGLSAPVLATWGLSFWVAFLSLPQVVHYFLDAFLWKMNRSNPDLKEMFATRSTPAQEVSRPG